MTERIVIDGIYERVKNVQFHVFAKDDGGRFFTRVKTRLVHMFTGDSRVSRRVSSKDRAFSITVFL